MRNLKLILLSAIMILPVPVFAYVMGPFTNSATSNSVSSSGSDVISETFGSNYYCGPYMPSGSGYSPSGANSYWPSNAQEIYPFTTITITGIGTSHNPPSVSPYRFMCCERDAEHDGYGYTYNGKYYFLAQYMVSNSGGGYRNLSGNKACIDPTYEVSGYNCGDSVLDAEYRAVSVDTFTPCSVATHCQANYYYEGGNCVACPESGTAPGYRLFANAGKTTCRKTCTNGSDASGTYTSSGTVNWTD